MGESGLEGTLRWNQEMALSHLLTMEEHYKNLSVKEVPNAWCIVKHYLLACNHHVEEAIGHTERLGLDSKPYRKFRDDLRRLESYPQPRFKLPALLDLRTRWRQIIGDPTLEEACPICDADVTAEMLAQEEDEEVTAQAHGAKPVLVQMEREYLDALLDSLAEKEGVEKPPFMIVDCGEGDPTGRAITAIQMEGDSPFLVFCSGGGSAHLAAHEFDHYRRHINGECDLKRGNCSEDEAENYALDNLSISQALKTQHHGEASGKTNMRKEQIATVYFASLGSTAASIMLKEVDKRVTWGTEWYMKPSIIVSALVGVGIPLISIFAPRKPLFGKGLELPAMIFAAGMTGELAKAIVQYKYPDIGGVRGIRRVSYSRPPMRNVPVQVGGGSALF